MRCGTTLKFGNSDAATESFQVEFQPSALFSTFILGESPGGPEFRRQAIGRDRIGIPNGQSPISIDANQGSWEVALDFVAKFLALGSWASTGTEPNVIPVATKTRTKNCLE
jgi:hypothetical protein